MTREAAWRAAALAALGALAALAAAGAPGARAAEILQVSDVHLDALYRAGGSVKTGCHRVPSIKIPGGPLGPLTTGGTGAFGDASRVGGALGVQGGRCGTPPALWGGVLSFARAWSASARGAGGDEEANASFVLWTGDSVRADNDPTRALDRAEAARTLLNATAALRGAVGDAVRVLPAVGASDVFPPGVLAPGPGDELRRLAAAWKGLLPDDRTARDTFSVGGYYEAAAGPRLRVAVLNTVYFSPENTLAGDCDRDDAPGRVQLMWLRRLLRDAEGRGDRVLVAGHQPPSADTYRPACLALYREVAAQHRGAVAGHLFGGLHSDEFSFLTADSKPPRELDDVLGVVLAAPSVTPQYNGAVRVYEYAAAALGSYTQYYIDVARAASEDAAVMVKEYSTVEGYRMADLSPASWWDLAARMVKDPPLAQLYIQFQHVSSRLGAYKAPQAPPRPPAHLVPLSSSTRASESGMHSSVYASAVPGGSGPASGSGSGSVSSVSSVSSSSSSSSASASTSSSASSASGSASSASSSASAAGGLPHVAFRDGLRHYIEWSD